MQGGRHRMLITKNLNLAQGETISISHENCFIGVFNFDLPQVRGLMKNATSSSATADVHYTNRRIAINFKKQLWNLGILKEEFCLSINWSEMSMIRASQSKQLGFGGETYRGVLIELNSPCSIFLVFSRVELQATVLWLLIVYYLMEKHPGRLSENSSICKTDWIVPQNFDLRMIPEIPRNPDVPEVIVECGKPPSIKFQQYTKYYAQQNTRSNSSTKGVPSNNAKSHQVRRQSEGTLSLVEVPDWFAGHKIYTLIRWIKNDGDHIHEGEELCSFLGNWGSPIIVYAKSAGYLQILHSGVNERYSAGEVIGRIKDKPLEVKSSFTRTPEKSSKTEANQIEDEINALIGLENVKKKVKSLINIAIVNNEREAKGLPGRKPGLHMVFTGNPGTGKTTIARKMGGILKQIGFLSRGHFVETDREGLVGGYLGQTAIKTKHILESAKGGILFIDEAYTLSGNDSNDKFGKEAIEILLTFMENNRNDLVVIVAGYSDEMTGFLESNPGLRSRFLHNIHFDDYNATELKEIFVSMIHEGGYQLTSESDKRVDNLMQIISGRKEKNFANAREVRNLYELILEAQATRIMKQTYRTERDLILIQENDINLVLDHKKGSARKSVTRKSYDSLEDMVGIKSVKAEIKTLINSIKVNKMRGAKNLKTSTSNLHIVFTGNPGTGKTTVARYLAKVFCEIGLISSEKIVETDRGDLVAGHLGQTAIKAKSVFDSALGGILFIDEAYDLCREGSQDDFGAEAISCLLKYMEDNRDNLIVICAGYEKQMNVFLQSNPGLRSRFNRFIRFEDYNEIELTQIFKGFCSSQQVILTRPAEGILSELMEFLVSNKRSDFANGRTIRNLFEKVLERQANRIIETGITGEKELQTIEAVDLVKDDILSECRN
jgi:SpoVK/Ycf46/Vps4 family AAA+-type ATPase